jgi:hypothetical protein
MFSSIELVCRPHDACAIKSTAAEDRIAMIREKACHSYATGYLSSCMIQPHLYLLTIMDV